MRVLQLIDSLDPGGAERVSVNIANALASQIDASFLCATRKEGLLKKSLQTNVYYVFLNKKKIIDFKAFKLLNNYVRKNKIDIVHAHSTSFFLATLVKLLNTKIIIIWHDHYGDSEYLNKRKLKILRLCSSYFSHVFSVNKKLEIWAKQYLNSKSVSYLPNFVIQDAINPITKLKGEDGKRIVHLANLRPQKDHLNLFDAFKKVVKDFPSWSLHCVGKDFNDQYSKSLQTKIKDLGLNNSIFLYGSKLDITHILGQSNVGVLSSRSEGLPIALLEYGLTGLPVVVTDVGDCAKVVENNKSGIVVAKENADELASGILQVLLNQEAANNFGYNLKLKVEREYSKSEYVKTLRDVYNALL